jgi:hypothetical protein
MAAALRAAAYRAAARTASAADLLAHSAAETMLCGTCPPYQALWLPRCKLRTQSATEEKNKDKPPVGRSWLRQACMPSVLDHQTHHPPPQQQSTSCQSHPATLCWQLPTAWMTVGNCTPAAHSEQHCCCPTKRSPTHTQPANCHELCSPDSTTVCRCLVWDEPYCVENMSFIRQVHVVYRHLPGWFEGRALLNEA